MQLLLILTTIVIFEGAFSIGLNFELTLVNFYGIGQII